MRGALFINNELVAEADVVGSGLELSRSKGFQRNVASLHRASNVNIG